MSRLLHNNNKRAFNKKQTTGFAPGFFPKLINFGFELAHLIEANHTPRFWNIIRAQAPTMEKAKAWLKENGQLLEQAI